MLFAGRGRKGGEERGRAPRAESEKTAEGDPRRAARGGIKGKGEGQRQAVAVRTGAEGDGGERTEGDGDRRARKARKGSRERYGGGRGFLLPSGRKRIKIEEKDHADTIRGVRR